MQQLLAFVECPHAPGWKQLAVSAAFYPLQGLVAQGQRIVDPVELLPALETWSVGSALPPVAPAANGTWVYNDRSGLVQDVIACIGLDDLYSNRQAGLVLLARLGDTDAECAGSDFPERWRRFLSCLNLYQFCDNFRLWAASEAVSGSAPGISLGAAAVLSDEWQAVIEGIVSTLQVYVPELAAADVCPPEVEHYNDNIGDDAFAEMAWTQLAPPIAVLAGDQADFAEKWREQGWVVATPDDLQANGVRWLIDLIAASKREA
jgi:DEAD/DEAH box helicase domain-containing protein